METEQTHQEAAPTPPPASSPKKMGKLRASYLLATEGFELLKKDKHILLFPVFSALACVALFLIPCLLYWFSDGAFDLKEAESASYKISSTGYAVILVFYLVLFFVTTYFQAGLMAVVHARINGRGMTFQEGMSVAKTHAEKIFLWSLVSATVGVVLGFISDRSKWFGKIISFFLRASWGIATFFIVPVLILEEGNISDSIKSSAETFKKTWGETIFVNFGTGLFFVLIAFLGLFISGSLMALDFVVFPEIIAIPIFLILLTVLIFFLIGIAIVSSAINSVFRVVLYEYAKSGHIADTFAPELILGALKKKHE